ncbi:hypothetical protein DTO195F2_578 [Paecilomyces variotii]|nr:hypothetical protein DTO195F2_578 [Paecilomyces variotii]KAJ9374918.1 hypothetical protein DTO282E5_473 [Paecilomyces variotii]
MTSAGSALNGQATKTVKSWRSGGADNWRGVRIPGSSSVGQRLAQVAFLASRERPSRGVPPTTRRVAVSVGVLS